MTVQQISRIQNRRGLRIDLPDPLNDAEFGWAQDTRELYIGNGVPFLGNTQILTDVSPATLPPYTYISNTGADAITGVDPFGDSSLPDASFQTIRTYQEKFDDFVNVRDYGAVGNGTIDDTGALIRALRDLYDEASGNDPRRNRALYIPAGIYRISQAIPLYPFCNLIGDGKGRTIIFLDYEGFGGATNPSILFITGNDCVARTVDSQGLSALNIGTGPGTPIFPQNIRVSGITFESNTLQTRGSGSLTLNGSIKEIIKLDLAKNVRFDDCEFKGTYALGDYLIPNVLPNGSIGVLISRLGDPSAEMKSYTFRGCTFTKLVHGFSVLDTISDVNVLDCDFKVMFNPIKIGFNPVLEVLDPPGPYVDAPELFRVSYSRFIDYEGIGFDVRSIGKGNISSYNHYATNGTDPAVRFDDLSDSCVSIGDTFDNIDIFTCADKLTTLRARNLSSLNVVMNAQDIFQIPIGFCGNILIGGNLQVTGDLLLGGSIVSTVAPTFTIAGVTTIASIDYAAGNIIFFEYGMNEGGPAPGGVYRAGMMRIAHNGDGTGGLVDPDAITFDDSYTEVGGPPANAITLTAVLNPATDEVFINADTGALTPAFISTIRIMTV